MNTTALVVLILTGSSDLPHHHWDQTTPILREWFNARVIEEPSQLRPGDLKGVDAVIVKFHGPRWG